MASAQTPDSLFKFKVTLNGLFIQLSQDKLLLQEAPCSEGSPAWGNVTPDVALRHNYVGCINSARS